MLLHSEEAKQLEKTIQSLMLKWEQLVLKRKKIEDEKSRLQNEIISLKKTFVNLTGRAPKFTLKHFPELGNETPVEGPNAAIGDAMEDILLNREALTTREIIDLLRARSVGISLRNPRIVIANTIKQDKNQRFVRLKDKRIALKEKADGNG